MLDSLHIKNYRNLKDLTIPSLGRVNLIVGKNNTGKSTLLEAVAIYASRGDTDWISQLQKSRGEYLRRNPFRRMNREDEMDSEERNNNIQSLSSLFTNHVISLDIKDAIIIGCAKISNDCIKEDMFCEDKFPTQMIALRFAKELDKENNQELLIFEITQKDNKIKVLPETMQPKSFVPLRPGIPVSCQFVKTRDIYPENNGMLFDKITLTDKEQNVIDALKILEPLTERIAFKQGKNPFIKLSDSEKILPLQSMGDGINRILSIILALVNSDNSFLLIDEFENGLHHTVQEKLWDILFQMSQKLNVQIFATTHSEDCVRRFEAVLNKGEHPQDGKVIILHNEKGTIKSIGFDAKELKVSVEQGIDIR
ncbi:MAG: AAA family ATPase [Planctomycetaceae bacterium]|jgi:AAA15 family ATPase/GTPase|nr:AAA family ATPase [Planctomycetaceae bacterium]